MKTNWWTKVQTKCIPSVDMSTPGLHLVCTIVHQVVCICNAYPVHKSFFKFSFGFVGDVANAQSDCDGDGGDGQQLLSESNL